MRIKIYFFWWITLLIFGHLVSCAKLDSRNILIDQEYVNSLEINEKKLLDTILFNRNLNVDFSYPLFNSSAWSFDLPIEFYEIRREEINNKLFLIYFSKYKTKTEILDVRIATIEHEIMYHNNPVWEKGMKTLINLEENPVTADLLIISDKIKIKYLLETGELQPIEN